MADSVGYEDFYAICNHMPGADKTLRVGGTVVCPTSGWSAELREHERSGPPGINPNLLELDLVIDPPSDGDVVLDKITPVTLEEFEIKDPALEYESVYFFLVGLEDDEGPEATKVEHVR